VGKRYMGSKNVLTPFGVYKYLKKKSYV